LLGLASDGVHSNGFSLVRKVVERQGLSYHDKAPWAPNTTVGASLLTPTRIYVKPLLKAVEKDLLKGMAHITGGGLYDNIPRMLPKTLAAEVDVSAWSVPPVLKWLKEAGNVESREFARTWNTGLGMVIVVSKENAAEAKKVLEEAGERVSVIGKLFPRGEDEVVLKNLEAWN
ncbi:phosphoribosylformylglycinamidine cyclo-ligase-like protein, partial [Aureobasidium melanogenum]